MTTDVSAPVSDPPDAAADAAAVSEVARHPRRAGRRRRPAESVDLSRAVEMYLTGEVPDLFGALVVAATKGTVSTVDVYRIDDAARDPDDPAYDPAESAALVLVERRVTSSGPDRAACQYLLDRALGRPARSPDDPVAEPRDPGETDAAFEAAIQKTYGPAAVEPGPAVDPSRAPA